MNSLKVTVFFLFVIAVAPLLGQETVKPRISNVTAVPADAVPSGSCTASRSGYLETIGKEKMTEAKLANFVSSSLRDGYVLTIYPETKNGIFVNMECTAIQKLKGQRAP
jgi:hypothetical protein